MRQVRTLWLLAVVWTVVTHFLLLGTANNRTIKTDNKNVTMSTKRAASPKSEVSASVTASQKDMTATINTPVNTTDTSTILSSTAERMNSTSSEVTQAVTMSHQSVIPQYGNISAAVKEKNASKILLSATDSGQNHATSIQRVHLNGSLAGADFSSPTPSTSEKTPDSVFFGATPTTTTTTTTTSTLPLLTTTTTKIKNISTSTWSTATPPLVTTTNTTLPISSATVETKSISATGEAPTDHIIPKNNTSIQPTSTVLKNRTSSGHAIRSINTIDKTTGDNETFEMQENSKEDKFNLMLFPLNKTVPSTHGIPYENIHNNTIKQNLSGLQNKSSSQLNISLPDDGEIVLSQTGMWTTPSKLSATKVIRLGYLTGSQIRESNASNEFYSSGFYRRPGQVISGALTLAVVEINNNPLVLPEHRVEFLPQETYGEETESILRTTQFLDKNISAYIGPQETCMHEARLAAVFNIPMISYVSTRFLFSFFEILFYYLCHIFLCCYIFLTFFGYMADNF